MVGLALPNSITSILTRTFRSCFATADSSQLMPLIRTRTGAITIILTGAFRLGISACARIIVVIGLAETCSVAGILTRAFRPRISTLRTSGLEALIRAGSRAIAIILIDALAARIATSRGVCEMVRFAYTVAITTILRRTLCGSLATARTHALEALIGASARAIAIVLIGTFCPRVATGRAIGQMIHFA